MLRAFGIALFACLAVSCLAGAQSWSAPKNKPNFEGNAALVLTDGTVMVQDSGPGNGGGTNHWWRLTPDNKGSYVNGTWSKMPDMASTYGPLYHAGVVLADGRVIIQGGEYNFGNQIETNQGAIYDPVKNKWTSLTAPPAWSEIGDSPALVLSDGTYLIGQNLSTRAYLLNPKTLKWTFTGQGKRDIFAEEGFTLLGDGTVLLVDTENGTQAEKYLPSTGKWVSANSTIVVLPSNGGLSIVPELGPAVLRPDNTVFATGATSHTSVYHPPSKPSQPGKWTPGPDFPNALTEFDGPAALLPSGNVLCMTSPSAFNPGTVFFEWDGKKLNKVIDIPKATSLASFQSDMVVLPTGQVLVTTQTPQMEFYTPKGTPNPAWAPTISSVPTTITHGKSYLISGTQFNGLSQAAAYGDDHQASTNYPLVRITNNASKHVFYARTHDHSSMGVATKKLKVSTHFDVPSKIETGASSLVVVANGIASKAVAVTVQ